MPTILGAKRPWRIVPQACLLPIVPCTRLYGAEPGLSASLLGYFAPLALRTVGASRLASAFRAPTALGLRFYGASRLILPPPPPASEA